ncbi:hypothetical protein BN1051_00671 [Arthrobacter saudimassiliensis]|uniref:Uncharacterized protein n=1 Tax=Arthrobacter saudimassiliensis TaxID=1461584 RepID=A0A078MM59_9MICC|nr:hypothetical protein BN1051_00671 [Arthrobacter saudimassiliensis]
MASSLPFARSGPRPVLSRSNGLRSLLVALLALFLVAAPLGVPAGAIFERERPRGNPIVEGPNTDLIITRTGEGQRLTGALPPVGSTWPVNQYPTSIPAGYQTDNVDFAGVIYAQDVESTEEVPTYCIDIRTSTRVDIGYENGTWSEANVPNVGYVARILNSYYPAVPGQPAGLNNNQRAAAVQAAIWFFSDGYVVNPSNPLYSAVQAIVNDTIAAGPLAEPEAPDVNIDPPTAEGPVTGLTGPYTLTAEDGATLTVAVSEGYSLYSDAAGTQPLPETVPSGTQVWVRSDTGSTEPAVITARAVVTVQSGNVFLYDGNTTGVPDAQKLILAATRDISATAEATAEFFAVGGLTVTKSIAGEAAGQQGAVTIAVDCDADGQFTLEVPAETTEDTSQTFTGIRAGAVCTITEPVTGATDTVLVTPSIPAPVTITADTTATATVIDTYTFAPGTLVVEKEFTGDAVGNQDEIVLNVVCTNGLNTTVTIPAGQAETFSAEFGDLPAGTSCTVTEPTTGSTTEVTVTPTLPAAVTIPAAGSVTATVSNAVAFNPGVIAVNKVIAGVAAGQQGPVVLALTCTNGGTAVLTETITIPAGATGTVRNEFGDVPAGSVCSVTETATGATTEVGVVTESTGDATIPAGGGAEITVTDTYSLNPGSITVAKALAGPAVGQQGAVTLQVVCTVDDATVLDETVELAAGATAGTSQTFPNVPANASCAVTEPATGETVQVAVDVDLPDTVTVPPGGTATATVTDTYTLKDGLLQVVKTIDGEAAGLQEGIEIDVSCGPDGSVLLQTWTIPPGTTGETVAEFRNIPAGTECTVTEVAAGITPAITVVTVEPDPVAVPPGERIQVRVTDTYSFAPGTLAVNKVFAGAAAGVQGDVQLEVLCTLDDEEVLSETVDIPAGETEPFQTAFEDIPAGAECSVTEPVTGATETVSVLTDLPDPVTIPAGDGAELTVTNTYEFGPGILVVTKTIAGTAAGEQAEVIIDVRCTVGEEASLTATVTVPAGTTGSFTQEFTGVPAGSECAVTETADGRTETVSVETVLPAAVTVPAAGRAELAVVNTYAAEVRPAPAPRPEKPGSLPDTGSNGVGLAFSIGAGTLLLGSVLLAAVRRRRGTTGEDL